MMSVKVGFYTHADNNYQSSMMSIAGAHVMKYQV